MKFVREKRMAGLKNHSLTTGSESLDTAEILWSSYPKPIRIGELYEYSRE